MAEHTLVWGLLTGGAGFFAFFAYASFFEWALHKYIMHSLAGWYPFNAHALTHHGLFRADHTYHLRREQDKPKVTFAWWNAPGLYLVNLPVLLPALYFFGWPVFWGGSFALALNYGLYEYLHWCMHVPRARWLERTWVFRWLNAHHYYHHQYAFKNLNVVLPLADWVMGSLVPVPAQNPVFEQKKAA